MGVRSGRLSPSAVASPSQAARADLAARLAACAFAIWHATAARCFATLHHADHRKPCERACVRVLSRRRWQSKRGAAHAGRTGFPKNLHTHGLDSAGLAGTVGLLGAASTDSAACQAVSESMLSAVARFPARHSCRPVAACCCLVLTCAGVHVSSRHLEGLHRKHHIPHAWRLVSAAVARHFKMAPPWISGESRSLPRNSNTKKPVQVFI
jgi:hypothetical protein